MIKTVLFDVDGTILDTEFVMIKSLQKTLKEEKNLDVPEENLEYILGIPGKKAIERYSSSGEEVDKLHAMHVGPKMLNNTLILRLCFLKWKKH